MSRFFDGTARTPDEYAAWAYRLFKSGKTNDQIGIFLNLTPQVVAAMIESLPEFNADKDEAWRLHRAGQTYDQIGQKLGMSAATASAFAYSSNAMKKEYADADAAHAEAKGRAEIRAQAERNRIERLCSDNFVFKPGGMVLFGRGALVSIGEANKVRKEAGKELIRKPPTIADLARAKSMLEVAGYIVTATDRVAGPPPKPEPKPVFQCWNPDHRHMTASVADRCNAKHSELKPRKFKVWTYKEQEEALRLRRAGMKFREIAEKLGVSMSAAQGAVGAAIRRESEKG